MDAAAKFEVSFYKTAAPRHRPTVHRKIVVGAIHESPVLHTIYVRFLWEAFPLHNLVCSIIPQKSLFVKPLLGCFLCKKVFHIFFPILCKTVEKSVECAENLHIPAKIRLFSRFYAKKLWKTFVEKSSFMIIFYKSIDFL